MHTTELSVGTLARRTGLTVRTLHYYEEIGLLKPSRRTDAGHRRYANSDVARLQQIVSLRHLGFPLEEIRAFLDQPGRSVQDVIELHLSRLRTQVEQTQALCRRLEAVAAHLQAAREVSTDTFIETIRRITMHETYYSSEQLDALKQRRDELGEEQIQAAEAAWATLIDEVRDAMAKDADPASEPVQRLAARWRTLVEAFTGGDAGIRQSLQTMYEHEDPERASHGMVDPAVWAYMSRAMQGSS